MKAVIDTSSLVSLVRYYLPFDKEGKLKAFIEERIEAKTHLSFSNRLWQNANCRGKDKWLRFCLSLTDQRIKWLLQTYRSIRSCST